MKLNYSSNKIKSLYKIYLNKRKYISTEEEKFYITFIEELIKENTKLNQLNIISKYNS